MFFIGFKKTLKRIGSIGTRFSTGFKSGIDRQAEWLAHSLHSRAAFIWLIYGTVAWIPFVVLNIDPHGFLYLYIATSLSLITQVPLAMLALWAAEEGHRNQELIWQALENQVDMMNLLLKKFGKLEDEIIEEIHEYFAEDNREAGGVLPLDDQVLDVE